mmetsp:Transcript_8777/g.25902  ORF Transcript_8777/g.25902 Transcript_8777/m.25902 type:complete len:215 (-) Transcript_8777:148-792(-)
MWRTTSSPLDRSRFEMSRVASTDSSSTLDEERGSMEAAASRRYCQTMASWSQATIVALSSSSVTCSCGAIMTTLRSHAPQNSGAEDIAAALRTATARSGRKMDSTPLACVSKSRRALSRTVSNSMARPSSRATPSLPRLVRRYVALLTARQKSRKWTFPARTFRSCWNTDGPPRPSPGSKRSASISAASGESPPPGSRLATDGRTEGRDSADRA